MSKHCWTLKDRFESQFSAALYPIMLSDTKRAEIIHRAKEIRAVRNDISEVFFSDMLGFQDMTKFEAFNFFNPTFTTRLSSHYLKKAIEDVWKAYQLRFDAIRKKIEFEHVTELIPSFYKRRTKEHQVGDLKSIERHTKKTELAKVLTWLARYGNDDTVYWLESKIPSVDESKQKFYRAILRCISKFGFDRLMRLALSRREAVFAEYITRGKITFDSLTFSGNPYACSDGKYLIIRKLRANNRQLHHAAIMPGGKRRNNQAPREVRGFRLMDSVEYAYRDCFLSGRRMVGKFSVADITGKVLAGSVSYKKLALKHHNNTYIMEESALPSPTKDG